jgi:hypothetical protein
MGDSKTKDLAQRDPSEKLLKNCSETRESLSHTGHTGHMEPTKPQRIVLLIIAFAMTVGWAIIIWVATIVTQTMLDTLAYIVELAGMP